MSKDSPPNYPTMSNQKYCQQGQQGQETKARLGGDKRMYEMTCKLKDKNKIGLRQDSKFP